MKINQVLVEAQGSTVAFAFGRFNPAHQGHVEVWRAVEQAGANWFIGTNATTLGPNDPLTFEQKSAWMEEIYPPITGHIVAEQSVLTLAAYIFKKVRKNENATVAYITDATDWAWSGKLLNQYNGVEGAHGYYKFAQIIHEPSPRVSSATALRDAARADDRVAFYHASGTDPKAKVAGLTYFDTVKQACEKYPLPVKKAKKVKEGVAEAINPDILNPKFSHKQEIGDFTYTASTEQAKQYRWEPYPGAPVFDADTNPYYIVTWLNIKCFDNNKQIALAIFEVKGNEKNQQWLESYQTSVDKSYRGRGIASSMYAYAKMLGNDVKPSSSQSDQGQSMWKAWKKSGDAKHLTTMSTQVGENTEQKTVAKTWDQMTPQEKISGVKGRTVWNEKTKKYYTVFDVPAKQEEVDEASLATMRDYFAGDENARDPMDITKQRLHFAKDKNAQPTMDKRFRSQAEYEQWLAQNKLKPISHAKGWELINKRK